MRATHTDYKHPRHLRVEGCKGVKFFDGPCEADVLCVSPSSGLYAKLNKPGLPSFTPRPEPLKRPIVFDYGQRVVE